MSTINPLSREISTKIVYYGPGLSGKTTSLRHVYASVRAQNRGELISLSTEGDRTLFFDFLPVKIEHVRGLRIRLQLYTVPGQVFYNATRKLVLNGADGVIFVADSQPSARDSNLESMDNLGVNLAELGIELRDFPLVVQYNKRDLGGVMPVALMRSELNARGAPEFETVAARGDNVMPALKEITRLVVAYLKSRQRHRAAAPKARSEGIARELEAAAEAVPTPAPAAALPGLDPAARLDLSFARLFPGAGTEVAEVEMAIRDRTYGVAVRAAAEALADLLQSLPGGPPAPAARAALLGLSRDEYQRLCRLSAAPDRALGERDALFALYLLVAARVKAEAASPGAAPSGRH